LAISGFSFPFISLFAGCEKRQKSRPNPKSPDLEKKDRVKIAEAAKINPSFKPGYLRLHRNGELKKKGRRTMGDNEKL
jgi:hypothetical protein